MKRRNTDEGVILTRQNMKMDLLLTLFMQIESMHGVKEKGYLAGGWPIRERLLPVFITRKLGTRTKS